MLLVCCSKKTVKAEQAPSVTQNTFASEYFLLELNNLELHYLDMLSFFCSFSKH